MKFPPWGTAVRTSVQSAKSAPSSPLRPILYDDESEPVDRHHAEQEYADNIERIPAADRRIGNH
jgi:hypothetical protein